MELLDENTLKIWVLSPPVDGAANDAVIELLAKVLRLPKSSIQLQAGKTNRSKRFRLDGIEIEQVRERVNNSLA